MDKHPLVQEILYTNEQIVEASSEVAKKIDEYYKTQEVSGHTILVLGLLKGCVPFLAELIKHINYESETDYMVVSSYQGGLKSTGESKIVLDVNVELKNRHVLIVEDVIDSGITLEYIKTYLLNRGVKDIKIVTLIDKTFHRTKQIKPDWSCFKLEDDAFLIGFGLDYQERLRNLPYVGIMDLKKLEGWKW